MMKFMGWDEEQLNRAHSSTVAEIAAIMREQAGEDEETDDA
jgi:hypothetical protein